MAKFFKKGPLSTHYLNKTDFMKYSNIFTKDFFDYHNLSIVFGLGQGSVGKVYLASSKDHPGEYIAVKTFDVTGENFARSISEFCNEVHFMQTLSHAHLVPCHLAAKCLNSMAIAMPFYLRGDLVSNMGQLNFADINRCMLQVALAVEHLHGQDIVHTDIKLDNIFLDEKGHAHLGDLGQAERVSHISKTVSAGSLRGTKDYWPPERFKMGPFRQVDPFKGDVYAIGVTCWLLVAQDDPGVRVDYLARLKAAQDMRISSGLRSALERMLEPRPAFRASAAEAVEMLFMAMIC